MTDRAAFSDVEWGLLVRLPRWVAAAASAAEHDSARQTHAEEEAGLLAIADGRESRSSFVAAIARELVEIYDESRPDPTEPVIDVRHPAAGLAEVLDRARHANGVLAKAGSVDAAAYRAWLLAITDAVIGAVRSHPVLGLGGESVTAAERRFREQLGQALRG